MELIITDYFANGVSLLKLTSALGYRIRLVGKNIQFAKYLFCNERSIPCHTVLPSTDPEYFTPDEQTAVINACKSHVPDQLPFMLYYSSIYDAIYIMNTVGCSSVEEYGTDKIMTFLTAIPNVATTKSLISSTIPRLNSVSGSSGSFCSFSANNLSIRSDGQLLPTTLINTFQFRNSLNGSIIWSGASSYLRFDATLNYYCSRGVNITFSLHKNGTSVYSLVKYAVSNQYDTIAFSKIILATTNDTFALYVSGISGGENKTITIPDIDFIATDLGGN